MLTRIRSLFVIIVTGCCCAGACHAKTPMLRSDTMNDDSTKTVWVPNLLGADGPVTIEIDPGVPQATRYEDSKYSGKRPASSPKACMAGMGQASCYAVSNRPGELPLARTVRGEALALNGSQSVFLFEVDTNRQCQVALLEVGPANKLQSLLSLPQQGDWPACRIRFWKNLEVSDFVVLTAAEWDRRSVRFKLKSYEYCPGQEAFVQADWFKTEVSLEQTDDVIQDHLQAIQSRLLDQRHEGRLACDDRQPLTPLTGAIDGVYQGLIGDRKIALEIGAVEDSSRDLYCREGCPGVVDNTVYPFEGLYTEISHVKHILLEGTLLKDGSLRLKEFDDRATDTGDEWRLSFGGDHAIGTFCHCDVTQPDLSALSTTKVVLERLSLGAVYSNESQAAYNELLLNAPLNTGPEMSITDQIGYVMRTDSRFGVSMPHLNRFPDASILAKVNAALDAALEQRRVVAAQCLQSSPCPGIDERFRVLLNRQVLRVRREAYVNCGWIRSDRQVDEAIFDLRTGAGHGSLLELH